MVIFLGAVATTEEYICRRLHSELVRLLFWQAHRDTDRFFAASGVQLAKSNNNQLRYHVTVFSLQLRSKVGHILNKNTVLCINLNIDGTPIPSRSHTHSSHSQTSRFLTSSLFLGIQPSVCEVCRSLSLAFLSLSWHRHPCICILFSSRFIYS
jgi:hypothetical protein